MLLHYWSALDSSIGSIASYSLWFNYFMKESKSMYELLEAEPTIQDKDGAPEFRLVEGGIEFDQVTSSFRRLGNGKREEDKSDEKGKKENITTAVKDVAFKVHGGTTPAIVGETGGGKSTLLRLLCRFYDVDKGTIRVDEQDIRDVQLSLFMWHVSIVPQMIQIFNDTVLANLKYGNFDATQVECEAACESAALHHEITTRLANQYEEIIGERGPNLSGGELQRLAIARVLIRHDADKKIVLFDEAISSLDSETEWMIQARLREFCKGRTTIIVAHRLATIAHADMILAVKDGTVVECGRQEELLAQRGIIGVCGTSRDFKRSKKRLMAAVSTG